MSRRIRVIPVLLMLDGRLVKTREFARPQYVGDPINTVKIFNELEADELVLLDIGASKSGRGPDHALLEEIVSEAFMPIAYGGGVTSGAEARRLASLGIEKVAINQAALQATDVIADVAANLGSSSTLIAADIRRDWRGHARLWDWKRKTSLSVDPIAHIQSACAAGAGEVLVNDVRADGTMGGMDVAAIESIANAVDVPVIACGGAGSLDDVRAAAAVGADAVGAGAMFVYMGPHRAVMINYPRPEQLRGLIA